jgi:hypothetical protein
MATTQAEGGLKIRALLPEISARLLEASSYGREEGRQPAGVIEHLPDIVRLRCDIALGVCPGSCAHSPSP